MLTRIISGAVLAVLLGSACYFGGYYLWALNLFICIVGMRELYRAFRPAEDREAFTTDIMDTVGLICTALYFILIYNNPDIKTFFFFILAALILGLCVYVKFYPRFSIKRFIETYFSFVYVGVMLSFIYLVRASEKGVYTVWLIFITSWICDTCAYFTGVAIGKHRLAPVLSPKKSIEGAVGGVIGSGLVGFIYGKLIGEHALEFAVICAAGAVLSQFGDLFASGIKREQGIKDYGRLIPGHGGVLDRFDSVIVTAPCVYILLQFIK